MLGKLGNGRQASIAARMGDVSLINIFALVHECASLTGIVQIDKSSTAEKHRDDSNKRSIACFLRVLEAS
jgi:hypothetical protein